MGQESRPAPPSRAASRRHIVEMLLVGALASAVGIALGIWIDWFPMQASTQAAPIDTLWDVLVIASVPIFVLVTVVVVYAVRLFRQRPGEEGLDGPPIHGSTKLEVIWTALPAIMLIALCGYAWAVLVDIEEAPAEAAAERVVKVTGEQFAWSFTYNEGGEEFTSNRLHLPAGESVRFEVTSKDVLHDFWIPDMRMKIDAVPGITTGFRVTPVGEALGEHEIVCAELCGIGHAYMRQTAVVQEPGEFESWVRRMTAEAPAAQEDGTAGALTAEDGKGLYVAGKPDSGAIACGTCHTLAEAGTNAQTGPDLDEVLAGQDAAAIKASIVDPGAELTEGFGAGIMPATYGDTLSGAEVDALVEYLVEATK